MSRAAPGNFYTFGRRLKLGHDGVCRETVSTGQASAIDIRLIDESTLVIDQVILGMELADQLHAGKPPETPDTIVKFRVGASVRD